MITTSGFYPYSGLQARFGLSQKGAYAPVNQANVNRTSLMNSGQWPQGSQARPYFGLHPNSINYTGWPRTTPVHMKKLEETKAPAYDARFHAGRRKAFMDNLPPNTTVIIPGNTLYQKNNDVDFDFRQDSNFFYLTGFNEPDAIAVLSNEPGKPKFTLMVPPMDPEFVIWHGKRAGLEGAREIYKADKAFSNLNKSSVLRNVVTQSQNLMMIPAEANKKLNGVIRGQITRDRLYSFKTLQNLKSSSASLNPSTQNINLNEIKNPVEHLYKLRTIKTPYEIALMQRAVDISIKGHLRAMQRLKITPHLMKKYPHELGQGLNERVIQAEVEKPFTQYGGDSVAYPTIGSTGANSCVLHYFQNDDAAKPGQLAMIDAGSNLGKMAADISRTWPVGGKFSSAQKALYNIVLDAQESAIQTVKPGVTLSEINLIAQRKVAAGLIELGIMKGTVEEAVKIDPKTNTAPIKKYFPHSTSHTMGLDVHDVGIDENGKGVASTVNGKRKYLDTPIEAGWYFSVEPGIYITQKMVEEEGLDPKWADIGIRIEDNILTTPTGYKNLSEALPRTIEAIEALMKGRSYLPEALGL